MSEFILTRPQHAVVQKIGSYFKVSKKKLRESICENSLLDGVLYFPDLSNSELGFDSRFHCTGGPLNTLQIMDSKKFARSPLYQAYLAFQSVPNWQDIVLAYCVNGVVLVVVPELPIATNTGGEGYIHIAYDYLETPLKVMPIHNYLTTAYPHPS